jgi:opacity protein-like surface antigen
MFFAIPAAAQDYPRFEASGGYQFVHRPEQSFPFGLNIDGAINTSRSFSIAGDLGWAWDSDDNNEVDVDVSTHLWTLGVGPRFTARSASRVWPYGQFFLGMAHFRQSVEVAGVDISDSVTKFMIQPGGGVNINAGDGWGVVLAADYRRVFLDEEEDGESGENQFRFFAGIRLLLD